MKSPIEGYKCIVCGKLNPKSKGFKPRKKYCSLECKIENEKLKRRKLKVPELRKCKYCNKEFLTEIYPQKYCSKGCRKKSNRKENYKKYLETDRRYNEKNRERIRELTRLRYHKNKERILKQNRKRAKRDIDKNISRHETSAVIRFNEVLKKRIFYLKNSCKECEAIENLELHHEVYPRKRKEIRKAIVEGKIYYLCRKCHGKSMRIKI